MLNESFLNELKFRNDIVDVVSGYVSLKRAGSTYKGLCPFHSEKTPSFVVYPESQSFYCFGCETGGDVISFVQKEERLDYMETIRLLADRAGLSVPEDGVDNSMQKLKSRILEANREAARFFHSNLKSEEGTEALAYLKGRGLTDKTIVRFGLGYAKNEWDSLMKHLTSKGFTYAEMQAAGLTVERRSGQGSYDRFRNRVMFPIIDLRGNVIAFGGRAMDNETKPKYINTDDTPVFHKGSNLYALNLAKNTKRQELILCEGYMDVIAMHQAGFDNAVAGLGTALTDAQVRLIGQYVKRVVLSYDGDAAGQNATSRAITMFQQTQIQLKVLTVPISMAKDPDEFIKKYGPVRFEKLIDDSKGSMDYEILKIQAKHNIQTSDGKVAFIREVCQLLAGLPTPGEREIYAGNLSEICGVSRQNLVVQIEQIVEQNKKASRKKQINQMLSGPGYDKINPDASKYKKAAAAEEYLLCAVLKRPEEQESLVETLDENLFVTEFYKMIYMTMKRLILAGQPCNMTTLGQILPEDARNRLAKILAEYSQHHIYQNETDACIRILRDEQAKKKLTSGNASDDELKERMSRLKQDKK